MDAELSALSPLPAEEFAAFSRTVSTIYDAALDPDDWTSATAAINDFLKVPQTAIVFADHQNQSFAHHYQTGWSPDLINAMMARGFEWALQTGMASWPVGEVRHIDDLFSRQEFEASRFYREVLKPFRQNDFMGMIGLQEGSRVATVSVASTDERGLIPRRSIELLRFLSPHICRSIKIGTALGLTTLRSNATESVIDGLSVGVVLVNAESKVVYTNKAARELLTPGRVARIASSRLRAEAPDINEKLSTAIAACAASNTATDQATISISLPGGEDSLVATILPISSGERYNVMKPFAAAAAVFLQKPAAKMQAPMAALQELYGLTPAELKIATAMIAGQAVGDIADLLGITDATVRTHLKSMFHKTGVHRQAELMQLFGRAMSPLRPAD